MARLIPITVIVFIAIGAILSSCDSNPPTKPCDTCNHPCDTCTPCDTCDTTHPCDTCDTTTHGDPDSLAHAFTWTEYRIPDEANLTGCGVFSENLIYVMGTYLYRWTGSTWEKEKVVNRQNQLEEAFPDYSLFCLSPTDMWMASGIAIHYYNGGADRLFPPAPGPRACWGLASNDMFFVGDNGYISHFDGTTFTKFPQVTTKPLYTVWGTSHNDVWASGTNVSTGEVTLLHYDGSSWTEDPLASTASAKTSGLFDVWTYDSSGQTFVTSSGSNVYRKTGTGDWRIDTMVPNSLGGGSFVGLYLIKGNAANDLFAAGGWGWIGHWNGKTWHRYNELYDYSNLNYIAGALSVKGNTACVVGTKGGKSWIAIGRRK